MTDTDGAAWLGPAADELTLAQRERLGSEAQTILDAHPDPDSQDDRDACLSAVVQYLLGETTIDDAGQERARTRDAARAASLVAQTIARLAVQDGMSEVEAASRAHLDRMTVRKALGKG